MKKIGQFSLFIYLLFIGVNVYSQELNHLVNGSIIRKGRITLQDGKSQTFKNLKLSNDVISFSDHQGNLVNQKTSDVYKITKNGNYAAYGALLGGASCLVGALQGVNDANTINSAYGVKSSNDGSSLVLVFTVGGIVVGGLIGMLITNEKTVYRNKKQLSFYPNLNYAPDGKCYPTLSFKININ